MTATLPIYTLDQIEPLLDRAAIITAVREALIRHSLGEVQSPMPGQLLFPDNHGDCHIKFGHIDGGASFAVKIATGFYGNARVGLPTGNGLTLLFDARTGVPLCLFQDAGWMTAWRTAAATALAAECLSPVAAPRVGIIGTGLQAQLAVAWIAELLPKATFTMTGRDPDRTAASASACGARPVALVAQLLADADIVVTATVAASPLFDAESVRPGTHVVALGADGPEKQELPPALFSRAAHILTDDHRQCLALSDFGKAVAAGAIGADQDTALGAVLGGSVRVDRQPGDITIADLTGLAAQDIAIADWFGARLADQRAR